MPTLRELASSGTGRRTLQELAQSTSKINPIAESILQGIKNIPEAITTGVGEIASSSAVPPDPSQGIIDRILQVLKGGARGATAGIVDPEGGQTEAEIAQQTLGQTLGSFVPFGKGLKLLKAGGVPTRAGAPIVAGTMGAAEPLSRGDIPGALEGGTTGTGIAGLVELLGAGVRGGTRLAARPATSLLEKETVSQVSRLGPGGILESPLAGRVRNPLTNRTAFEAVERQFADQVGLQGTFKTTLPEISAKIPSKKLGLDANDVATLKQVRQLKANVRDSGNLAQLNELEASILAKTRTKFDPQNKAQQAVIDLQEALETSNGNLSLGEFQLHAQKIGKLAQSSDPQIFGLSGRVYKSLMDDLRKSKTPQAEALLKANKIARQNIASNELSDLATKTGSQFDEFGQLQVKPQVISKQLATNKFFRESFPKAQLAEIEATLKEVFKFRKGGDITRTIEKKGFGIQDLLDRPFIAAGAFSLIMRSLDLPIGFDVAFAAMVTYPRLITRAATLPGGRAFLRNLYKDAAPSLGNIEKTAIIASFNKSREKEQEILNQE